jgi:transcription antitermination protein NusB
MSDGLSETKSTFEKATSLSSVFLKQSRRFAVQFIYQCELSEVMFFQETLFKNFVSQQSVPFEILDYLKSHVAVLLEHMNVFDDLIESNSKNWKKHRIAKVDMAILRVCASELKFRKDVSPKVILSDAAEIGKEFGSSGSSGFINGVLDGILRSLKPAN